MKTKTTYTALFTGIVILFSIHAFSQSITLTFNATGATTVIDSIKVRNLTSCDSFSVTGNIVTLLYTGIADIVGNEGQKVYPNPFIDETCIEYRAQQAEVITITVFNALGEEAASMNKLLTTGINRFDFSPAKAGFYYASIRSEKQTSAYKLLCFQAHSTANILRYNGTSVNMPATHKNAKDIKNVNFTPGDTIEFICYAQIYSSIIVDAPTQDTSYPVAFSNCTDFDNNHYTVVKIGSQAWMAENLKTTHYNNGDSIPNVIVNTDWSSLSTGAYCNYNDDINFAATYGCMYNWFAIADPRGVCPAGWHLPTDAEWDILINYSGGYNVAGGKLKETCTTLWKNPNTGATNFSGFTGLPGGQRCDCGSFYSNINDYGFFWSISESVSPTAWTRYLSYTSASAFRDDYDKRYGFSVRCVMN